MGNRQSLNNKKSVVKTSSSYDYDVLIVGGGIAGLGIAKSLARQSFKKIGLVNLVKASPKGTTWDLGGTSTNAGCIPSKLLHHACINGDFARDCASYGWEMGDSPFTFDWETLKNNMQSYMKNLSDRYRVNLQRENIEEIQAFVQLVDKKHVKLHYEFDENGNPNTTNPSKEPLVVKVQRIVLAIGSRPKYLDIPGGRAEDGLCITSDDLFSLPQAPEKILCIGAGFVGVECAAMLNRLGCDCTIMVRSSILREFDNDIALRIQDMLLTNGVKIQLGFLPTEIVSVGTDSASGRELIKVTCQHKDTKEIIEVQYNTVLLAIGRVTHTVGMGLEDLGIKTNKENGRIITNRSDRTKQSMVFAIGDCEDGRLQCSALIKKTAFLLGRRMLELDNCIAKFKLIPRVLYTPIEYGFIGISEDGAIAKYGKSSVEIYLRSSVPLEYVLTERNQQMVYAKLITRKSLCSEKVIGFHYMGPYAAEITCAFAMVMRDNPEKSIFDNAIGIHPTCGEIFMDMHITRSSGLSTEKTGC